MANVQELLQALEARRGPMASLLSGLVGGMERAQEQAPGMAQFLIGLEQGRQDRIRMQEMDRKLMGFVNKEQEAAVRQGFGNVEKPATPASPAVRLSGVVVGETGHLRPKFDVVEPKFQHTPYYDPATKQNRIGAFDPTTGELHRSPSDPVASMSMTVGEKEQQYQQKRLTALGEALDPSKQRTGAFGVSKQVFDRAERLQALAVAFKDGNLDSRQIEELAIGLNAMLSGANVGAQEQVRALVPRTIVGNARKTWEWLSNEPQGTDQRAFVQRMLGSIEREKATAAEQIKRTQFQRVARYTDLERSSPDEFYNVLQSAGVEPDEYKAWRRGGFKPIGAVQKSEDTVPVGASTWTLEKEARYQELLKKHGGGVP